MQRHKRITVEPAHDDDPYVSPLTDGRVPRGLPVRLTRRVQPVGRKRSPSRLERGITLFLLLSLGALFLLWRQG